MSYLIDAMALNHENVMVVVYRNEQTGDKALAKVEVTSLVHPLNLSIVHKIELKYKLVTIYEEDIVVLTESSVSYSPKSGVFRTASEHIDQLAKIGADFGYTYLGIVNMDASIKETIELDQVFTVADFFESTHERYSDWLSSGSTYVDLKEKGKELVKLMISKMSLDPEEKAFY